MRYKSHLGSILALAIGLLLWTALPPADPVVSQTLSPELSTMPSITSSDVTMGNWAWSYIYKLRELGITAGCATDPPRCPSDPLNRGQLATMLNRMLTGPESSRNIDTPAEPTWPG